MSAPRNGSQLEMQVLAIPLMYSLMSDTSLSRRGSGDQKKKKKINHVET